MKGILALSEHEMSDEMRRMMEQSLTAMGAMVKALDAAKEMELSPETTIDVTKIISCWQSVTELMYLDVADHG